MTELNNLIRVARGDAPADLVLRNAKLVNVYSGEIYPADVAIYNARIAAVGSGWAGAGGAGYATAGTARTAAAAIAATGGASRFRHVNELVTATSVCHRTRHG